MSIDYDQLARNVLYGLVHRPAQLLRWIGGRYSNQAAPVGAAIQQAASQIDSAAFSALGPYLPPSPPPNGLGTAPPAIPPPPPTGPIYVKPSGPLLGPFTCPVGYKLKQNEISFAYLPEFTCVREDYTGTVLAPISDLVVGGPGSETGTG